jgi:hypothetical protein
MPKIKTERSWLASTTPHSLLLTLKGKRQPRQRRLFAVACCRRVLEEMTDEASRRAVETAERYADGLTTRGELDAAHRDAQQVAIGLLGASLAAPAREQATAWARWQLAYAAQLTCSPNRTTEAAEEIAKWALHHRGYAHHEREKAAQCALIRDVFGNPFQPPPVVEDVWLNWNGGTVPKLARAIYDERRFVDLPILADALEEAGCGDSDILSHCRDGGEHVRGCWVLDLLLGKT